MRVVPVKTMLFVVLRVEPKPDFDDRKKQARNREGIPQWWLHVVAEEGDPIRVTVPSADRPAIERLDQVEFRNLMAGISNGRFWFAAEAVRKGEK